MKMRKTFISTAVCSLLFPTLLSPAVSVKASEVDKISTSNISNVSPSTMDHLVKLNDETHNIESQPTVEEIQSLDLFVFVENNQFVLKLPEGIEVDDVTYNAVVSSINKANEEITKNNATINEITKTIDTNEITLFSSQGYTSQKFWWGERGIYTNAQTNAAVKQGNVAAAQIGLGTAFLAFIPLLGPLAAGTGVTAAYITLLTSKMDAANNGRGVIVDMTWALVFTVKSR